MAKKAKKKKPPWWEGSLYSGPPPKEFKLRSPIYQGRFLSNEEEIDFVKLVYADSVESMFQTYMVGVHEDNDGRVDPWNYFIGIVELGKRFIVREAWSCIGDAEDPTESGWIALSWESACEHVETLKLLHKEEGFAVANLPRAKVGLPMWWPEGSKGSLGECE